MDRTAIPLICCQLCLPCKHFHDVVQPHASVPGLRLTASCKRMQCSLKAPHAFLLKRHILKLTVFYHESAQLGNPSVSGMPLLSVHTHYSVAAESLFLLGR